MKVLFNILYYSFLAAVVGIGLLIVASLMPIPGNVEIKVVKSGSMEPAIHTGGIVVIKPSAEYVVGDVITFGPDTKTQIPTTHRILEAQGQGASQTFTTKGDANDAPDPVVTKRSEVDGKVVLTVPYAGYVLDFAKKPLGFALLVGVPAAAIIVEEIGKIVGEVRTMRKRRQKHTYVPEEIPIKPERRRVN